MVKKLLILLLLVPLCTVAADDTSGEAQAYNSRSVGYRLDALIDMDDVPRGVSLGAERDETMRNLVDTVHMLGKELSPFVPHGGPTGFIDYLESFTNELSAEVVKLTAVVDARDGELADLRRLLAGAGNVDRNVAAIAQEKAMLAFRVKQLQAQLEGKKEDIEKLLAVRTQLLAENGRYALVIIQQEGVVGEIVAELAAITVKNEATRVLQEESFEAQAAALRMNREQARAKQARSDAERDALREALEASAAREADLRRRLQESRQTPQVFYASRTFITDASGVTVGDHSLGDWLASLGGGEGTSS